MLFNSYGFLGVFLPVTLAAFAVMARVFGARGGLVALAGSSLVFYGMWLPAHLILLLGSVTANFAIGLRLGHLRRHAPALVRPVFMASVAGNLGLIAWFKYAGFLAGTAATLSGFEMPLDPILLPLGISFFTFQQIAYLSAVAVGGEVETDPLRYAVFICFFGHLIAGPLVHPGEILPQLARLRDRLSGWNLAMGGSLFIAGLAKKALLADTFAPMAAPTFSHAHGGSVPGLVESWVGALGYTLQIYFDFSGYSEMAMGLALLFGLRFPVNFNSPYKARNIIEFWRRWHITLSIFLRDHVYIPLGGSRRGSGRRHANLMATMLIGGLWHGASWTFIAWGGLHGLYLMINHGWHRIRPDGASSRLGRALAWTLTFLAVVVAWVLFRAESFGDALRVYQGMAGMGGIELPIAILDRLGPLGEGLRALGVQPSPAPPYRTMGNMVGIAAGLVICLKLPNTIELFRSGALHGEAIRKRRLAWHATAPWAVGLGILAALAVLELQSPSEFIYFNF